jgi:8-amino-7-oxononanoate synthase
MRERMAAALTALRASDQLRELTVSAGIPLGSNDYLGLSGHPRLKLAIERALAEDGRFASTGARLLSGNHLRWELLECEFARFIGAEAALYFSSGYAANIGLLSSILKSDDTVFSDAANHASLIDGIRLSHAKRVIFPHLNMNYLEDAIRRNPGRGQRIIVVESLFSMEGDRAPFDALFDICERFDAFLIVDEAHATGVEGENGRGLVDLSGRNVRVLATVHTCGKALASVGAFVAGSRLLYEYLVNHARPFIFSTALPPFCAAHVREAVVLAGGAEAERRQLRQLSQFLRRHLRAEGFNVGTSESQIVPLILGSNEEALRFACALNRAGFAVRAIRPPTVPPGSARLRFSLNANLHLADLERLIEVLRDTQRRGNDG